MPPSSHDVRKNLHALAPLSAERLDELYGIQRRAIAGYTGTFDELETALGLLYLGDHLGWKPLVLIHNKRTIRKYEEILGIEIREFFPPEGPSAHRSIGYTIAKKIGSFWKAVSGELKDDELRAQRREIL